MHGSASPVEQGERQKPTCARPVRQLDRGRTTRPPRVALARSSSAPLRSPRSRPPTRHCLSPTSTLHPPSMSDTTFAHVPKAVLCARCPRPRARPTLIDGAPRQTTSRPGASGAPYRRSRRSRRASPRSSLRSAWSTWVSRAARAGAASGADDDAFTVEGQNFAPSFLKSESFSGAVVEARS